MTARLTELLDIVQRLRGVDGCPWDRVQTFASIAPYTIEESYEVADAIERGDMAHLKDELGDLLFQVVFHAQIAQESGFFDFDGVAAAICDKLIRRHPHVFGGRPARDADPAARHDGPAPQAVDAAPTMHRPASIAAQIAVWEDIKARERAATGSPGPLSALEGVPLALPALMRAFKLSKRAARVGFDFERAADSADKVAEELAEVREAAIAASNAVAAPNTIDTTAAAAATAMNLAVPAVTAESGPAPVPAPPGATPRSVAELRIFEEVGDLLFAAANLARKLEVDPEAALRAANLKFERRFHGMERLAAQRGENFERLNLVAQEALWQAVKRAE
jgi:uncharacterized protein YabN with tetrapyrrole methylase and pyrophosphatase domain